MIEVAATAVVGFLLIAAVSALAVRSIRITRFFHTRWKEGVVVIERQEAEIRELETKNLGLAVAADKTKDGLDPHQLEYLKLAELSEQELDRWLIVEALARGLLPMQIVAELHENFPGIEPNDK